VAQYRNNRGEGWFVATMDLLMLLLGLLFLVGGIAAGHGAIVVGLVLAAACWAMFGYRGYVEVVLVADRLETDGEVLRWSGLVRHGRWLVRDIATMRRQWATGYVRVGTKAGERLCVRPTKGWEEFAPLIAPTQTDFNVTRPNFMERGLGPRSKFRWRGGWTTRP
jgi:hypothetical protein